MSVNVENIDKTIARIRANQNFRFNMSSWGGAIINKDEVDQDHFCGTSACIAGFAVLASDKYPVKKVQNDKGYFVDILDIPVSSPFEHDQFFLRDGAELLGLSHRQATALFTPWQIYAWDTDDRKIDGPDFFSATEDQAIAVLEHLKETGIVDWSVSGIKGDDGFYEAYRENRGREFTTAVSSE